MGSCCRKISQLVFPHRTHNIGGKRVVERRLLAEGGYGYVYLVEDVSTGEQYAMKKVICQNEQQRNLYNNEVNTLKALKHSKHIIGFFGSHEIKRDDFLEGYILMELAEKTVHTLVMENQAKKIKMEEKQILKIIYEAACGLNQMHQLGLMHQDIKIENILFVKGTAKLCDLGSSSSDKVDLGAIPKSQVYLYEERFSKFTTLMYRPPEMVDTYLQYPVDQRSDVWMLGCALFILNYDYHPFQEMSKLSIVNASVVYRPTVNPKMIDLMREMLTPNPNYRASVTKIIKIIESWDSIKTIKLNKIAEIIKKNEEDEAMGRINHEKIEWRDVR